MLKLNDLTVSVDFGDNTVSCRGKNSIWWYLLYRFFKGAQNEYDKQYDRDKNRYQRNRRR